MKSASRVLLVGLVTLLLSLGAFAQLTKGFRGKVYDKDGKSVAGAPVTIQDQSNAGNHYEIKTDSAGTFVQIGIPYSDKGYTVSVQVPGLPPMTKVAKPKLMDVTEMNFDPRRDVGFQGTVKDKQGKVVSGAQITLVNLADEAHPYKAKTDSKGVYEEDGLPYSDKGYTITALIPGEQPFSKTLSIPQIAMLEVSFNFANPGEAGGGGSAGPNHAAEAKQLYELGDYEGALGKAQAAIDDKASDADNVKAAKFIKAVSLDKLEHTADALAAFEDYNKAYPGDVNVLGALAKLAEEAGDTTKAEAYKKEFAAKGGKITGETYNDGVKAFNDGDLAKATQLFQKAIKEDPKDADSIRELGRTYGATGNYAGAVEQFKLYLKAKPDAKDAAEVQSWITALEPLTHPPKK